MVLEPGARFDHFIVEALLGEGGMGQVYRAFDVRLERRVALKILHAPAAGSCDRDGVPACGSPLGAGAAGTGAEGPGHDGPGPDPHAPTAGVTPWTGPSLAGILREARAAAALDHPNAVSIFEVGEQDGTPFLAMELVAGTALRALIGRAGVALEQRLRWLSDIGRALDAAHRAGIVHLDVKPENVMVRTDGVVKVLDFGIARRTEMAGPVGQDIAEAVRRASISASAFAGTPAYMAPEQVRGHRVDGRTDQFAWGIVAFELLSGRKPWPADAGIDALLRAIALADTPRLRGVAPAVEAVVLRALEKSPDDRFPTMADAAAALEGASGLAPAPPSGPFSAPESPWGYPSDSPTETIPQLVRHVITDAPRTPEGAAEPAPAPAAEARSKRRSLPRLAGVVLGAALPIVALAWAGLAHAPGGSLVASTHGPPAHPVTLLDLPAPEGCKPEARAAYEEGMHALHEGAWDRATARFERAVAADPGCADAELRLVVTAPRTAPVARIREAYARAQDRRASLSERDRLLLDAFDPLVRRDPGDERACGERLRALAGRFPGDAELAFLASSYSLRSDPEAALASAQRAVALDPGYADGWETLAFLLGAKGQAGEAAAALDACLRASPNAVDCVTQRVASMRHAGRCGEMEGGARQWIARDPDAAAGYLALAQALAAEGRPREAVEEALRQRWSRLSADERARAEPYERALLAVHAGDFSTAERFARDLRLAVEGDASFDLHARAAFLLAAVLRETGRAAEAAEVASDLLRRKPAWSSHLVASNFEADDHYFEALLLIATRDAPPPGPGWLAERAAWVEESRSGAKLREDSIWSLGVAAFATTQGEAVEALRSMPPTLAARAHRGGASTHLDADVFAARALLLAGRPAEALALARPVAGSCIALELPFLHTEAELVLAEALEATGDAAACAAYGAVVGRWGDARPRATTAERARAHATSLGCAR